MNPVLLTAGPSAGQVGEVRDTAGHGLAEIREGRDVEAGLEDRRRRGRRHRQNHHRYRRHHRREDEVPEATTSHALPRGTCNECHVSPR